MDIFDRKDPKISFGKLAQLRKTGTLEAFIVEFERVVVQVTDISKHRLVILFTEGLDEPLHGWVKAFKPTTVLDAIMKTLDMTDTIPKTKGPTKPCIPPMPQDRKPFQKEWTRKDHLDEETQRELSRKKLCFTRKDPLEPSHRCMGKGKVLSNGEDDEETGHVLGEVHNNPEEDQPHSEGESSREEPKKVVIATLSGVPKYYTFKIRVFV
jgi:hypothetical protein